MLPDHTSFLNQLFFALEPVPGTLDHFQLDHLCYRVETEKQYKDLKAQLLEENELLVESPINGRRIATFRMTEPFRFREREIWLLELPEPKAGSPYPEGWEHVEFVTDRPLETFAEWMVEHLGVEAEDIDRSGMSKPLNADLRLRLEGGLSVKFHELALDVVILMELAAT
jgi:predicted metalloenzyme YecM